MKKSISTHHAKTHLSKIIEEVLSGAEFIVCRGKEPVVEIVRYQGKKTEAKSPRIGTVTSKPVRYAPGTFSPLSDQELDEWGLK